MGKTYRHFPRDDDYSDNKKRQKIKQRNNQRRIKDSAKEKCYRVEDENE